MIMSAALFVGIFMASVSVALEMSIALDRHRRRRGARLARCTGNARPTGGGGRSGAGAAGGPSAPRHRGTPGPAGHRAWLAGRIARSGLSLTPAEIMVTGLCGALGLGAGAWGLLGLPLPLALALALCVPVASVWLILTLATQQRMRRMTDALPEALDILVRGLRAGRPVGDALAIVADGTSGGLQAEFQRCSDELRLGKTISDVLHAMAQRVDTPELRAIAVATALQAETGGNLIETLENLADLLRDRQRLRRRIVALTAEARVSALILAALPFAVGAVILGTSPRYLQPLLDDPRGQVMLAAGLGSLCLGILSMHRMAKLDV